LTLEANVRETRWCFFGNKWHSSPLPQPRWHKQDLAATLQAQEVEGLTAKMNTNAGCMTHDLIWVWAWGPAVLSTGPLSPRVGLAERTERQAQIMSH